MKETVLVHPLQCIQFLEVLLTALLQLVQLSFTICIFGSLDKAEQLSHCAGARLICCYLSLQSLSSLFDLEKLILMRFYLLDDEVDLIFHLFLGMENLMSFLLIDEIVVDIGTPNGSIGRHHSHQIHSILDDHLDQHLELQLFRAHPCPRRLYFSPEKVKIHQAKRYTDSWRVLTGQWQSENETDRDHSFTHADEGGQHEVPIRVTNLETHDFEEVHGEEGERAGKGDEEDQTRKSMPDLLFHQVLRHDGVAQPTGSQNGEKEAERRIGGAYSCQPFQHIRNAHQIMIILVLSQTIVHIVRKYNNYYPIQLKSNKMIDKNSRKHNDLSISRFPTAIHMFQLNEQQFASFKRAFDLFDRDGNGTINKEEIGIVFRELNIKLSDADLDRIMRQFDENGDACIEFEEFIRVLSQNVEASEGEAWLLEVFEIIDQDCDGRITLEDLKRTVGAFGLGIEEKELRLIMEACQDSAQGLTYEEFSGIIRLK